MSSILVIAGLVFGAYLYQPMWFDDTPYHHVSTHKSLAECQTAKTAGTDDVFMKEAVCAGGELYVKDGKVETVEVNDFVFTIDKDESTDTTMKSHWSE
jgi:hypothetical protein